MMKRLRTSIIFCILLGVFSPGAVHASDNSNLSQTLTALLDVFFKSGGVMNAGLAGGQELSLANDYRRNLDFDLQEFRSLPTFHGNEKPKAGGVEVALGFDWDRFFILYSGRWYKNNLDTTLYSSAPPFQTIDVRTTTYKDAGLLPRDLLLGMRFFPGKHVIQLHAGARSLVENSTFTERNAPLVLRTNSDIADAVSNRFSFKTSGLLLGAGYRYEFSIFHFFAEVSIFRMKGSYSMNIASFESLGFPDARVREISVDQGRINGYGGEAVLGLAMGKRFGPRLGVRRTALRLNFHRELHAAIDSTRPQAALNAQALYLSRVRNKRGVSTAANSIFVEMRFAADLSK